MYTNLGVKKATYEISLKSTQRSSGERKKYEIAAAAKTAEGNQFAHDPPRPIRCSTLQPPYP